MYLDVFNFGNKNIRTTMIDDDIWFVAKDVTNILEIANNRQAVARIDDDEKGVIATDTLGGKQNLTYVNEYGLYNLVIGSRKPEAKQFTRWITHEVIPTIRRTGNYSIRQDSYSIDDPVERAKKWIEEETERQKLVIENKLMQPKALFADAVETSEQSVLIGELSKIIRQNGVEIGQNRLFSWLRGHGYLMIRGENKNLPTQKSMDLKLMEIKKRTVNNADGSVRVTRTTKVTGKGQVYFVNKFLKIEDEKNE